MLELGPFRRGNMYIAHQQEWARKNIDALGSLVGVFSEAFLYKALCKYRNILAILRLVVIDVGFRIFSELELKRKLASQHFISHHPYSPDVDVFRIAATEHLWSFVVESPRFGPHAGSPRLGLEVLGDLEVYQLDAQGFRVIEGVLRLDVSVTNAFFVYVCQCNKKLSNDISCGLLWQNSLCPHIMSEFLVTAEFHYQLGAALFLVNEEVVGLDDVLMGERLENLVLCHEVGQQLLIAFTEQLDSELFPRLLLPAPFDH